MYYRQEFEIIDYDNKSFAKGDFGEMIIIWDCIILDGEEGYKMEYGTAAPPKQLEKAKRIMKESKGGLKLINIIHNIEKNPKFKAPL